MQGSNLLYICLLLAVSVYLAETQQECRNEVRGRFPSLDIRCRRETEWKTVHENDRYQTECRCIRRLFRQCRRCEKEVATTTTTEGTSETTVSSGIPETTINTVTPEITENPELPVTSENPELPATPENPELPATPENPELPATPETPEQPGTTENPELPGASTDLPFTIITDIPQSTLPSEASTTVAPPEIPTE